MHNSARVLTNQDLNRISCDPDVNPVAFLFKDLCCNNLPFPSLSNRNRSGEEVILYWRICYPDVKHDLKVHTFPPYPAADI